MPKCKDCGADIEWKKYPENAAPHEQQWIPYNTESDFTEVHFYTCRKPEEKPLTREQLQRPGYL